MHYLILFSLVGVSSSFFFGCGCQQQSPCQSVCPPIQTPQCPPSPCISLPPPSLPSGGYVIAPQGPPPPQYVPVYNQPAQQVVQQLPSGGQYSIGGQQVQPSPAPIHETTQYAREEIGVADEQIPDSPPDVSLNVDPSKGAAAVKVARVEESEEEIEKKEEKPVDVSTLKLTDDPLCNSEDLRALMLENIDDNLNSSKRLIQLAAEAQYGGRFDVICANGDFSYVTNTELFCQESKGDVSCYTYRQL
ncbi:grl-7 [Pristionchus pacificus]|uniref:Grl-7 n=1 Tax=Pristionchus pacificus TaxID=54126 RepID=A0A454Y2J2_PRIPA|nr:grl-7 [Pristionchus pacificus]|eukprot:PDM80547.1 grl-7 [Pristionchus pacificus]